MNNFFDRLLKFSNSYSRKHHILILTIAFSGMASLGLEIIWMRMLVQSFSATVYAFTIMLACFLFGIYYGSMRASQLVDKSIDLFTKLGLIEIGVAASVATAALLSYIVPTIFSPMLWSLTKLSQGGFAFASVISQFAISSVLILLPTTLLGATFPIAVRLYTPSISLRARSIATVYAANTAGAIVGAVAGGMVVLPLFGTYGGMIFISAIFFLSGMLILLAEGGINFKILKEPLSILLMGITIAVNAIVIFLPSRTVINYGLQKSFHPKILYHGEGISNTVDIVQNEVGDKILSLNGNVEADTSLTQRRHFILKAYLPLLMKRDPRDVAVVGLGLGITLRATARFPNIRRIRVVELSSDIVKAHQYLTDITDDILANPIVSLRIDDGRNFMAMSNENFDMITADPIHPRITGVGYLYTREYYESIKSRLKPGGTIAQWMPMYNISRKSFDIAFRTFAEVFPNSSFWYVRGHGLFIATDGPLRIDCDWVKQNFNDSRVKADFASVGIETMEQFMGYMLMDRKHIDSYLARNTEREINTDNNALLEYRTPFEFLGKTSDIVPDLVSYAGWDIENNTYGCEPSSVKSIKGFLEDRLARIKPELETPLQ